MPRAPAPHGAPCRSRSAAGCEYYAEHAAGFLAAGNTVLLKHASNVPQCALAIERVFEEAGFPEGVFGTLLVDSEAVGKLIADPRVHAASILSGIVPAKSLWID